MIETTTLTTERILKRDEVARMTGQGRKVYLRARDPDDDFPAAVRLGPRAVGWLESEILAWIASRPRTKASA